MGGPDSLLELHVADGNVERTRFTGPQLDPAGMDQAVVVGQLLAGAAQCILAARRTGERVDHEEARFAFSVGLHPQEDQVTEFGEPDLTIGEGLVGFLHRFGQQELALGRVVLDAQLEGAVERIDEHTIEDRHVGSSSAHVEVASDRLPLEVELRGEDMVAFAPIVEIPDLAVGGDLPSEHADVGEVLADLEHGEQPALEATELQQPGGLVVRVEFTEVALELRVVEPSDRVAGGGQDVAVAAVESVQREHVVDGRLGPESDEDVVAEEQMVADADDVARHAVVLRADAGAVGELEDGLPERGEPVGVQRLGPPAQLGCVHEQPIPEQLVGAMGGAVVDSVVTRGGRAVVGDGCVGSRVGVGRVAHASTTSRCRGSEGRRDPPPSRPRGAAGAWSCCRSRLRP